MDKKPRIPKSTAMQRAAHNLANELQDTDSRPSRKATRPMALGRKNKINNENIKQRSKMPLRKRGNGSSGGGSKPPKKKDEYNKAHNYIYTVDWNRSGNRHNILRCLCHI